VLVVVGVEGGLCVCGGGGLDEGEEGELSPYCISLSLSLTHTHAQHTKRETLVEQSRGKKTVPGCG
jgi:hypothetical protein